MHVADVAFWRKCYIETITAEAIFQAVHIRNISADAGLVDWSYGAAHKYKSINAIHNIDILLPFYFLTHAMSLRSSIQLYFPLND